MREQEQVQSVQKDVGNGDVTAVHRDESRRWYWKP